ncbi:MAG: hypothetical protein ABI886_18370, partial [Betaproteobacteria bacterium]
MDAVALIVGSVLPWLAGTAGLVALRERTRALDAPGEFAWLAGAGWLVGAFALTLWMRALSLAGVPFGRMTIAAPLLVVTAVAAFFAWRRDGRALVDVPARNLRVWIDAPGVARAARIAGWVLAATLALRFALLLAEVLWRPLFPWDAWTQWATKARVWYELGHIAPFVDANAWLAGNGTAWFDAAPAHPPTLPLLQVWMCVVLGRWDDALMNLPWWLVAVALALSVYGALRRIGAPRAHAFAGTFLVSTLPLANAHVALAGYGDLPLAAYYTAAVLAFLRWHVTRDRSEAVLAAILALACTQIRDPGLGWALTLVPGIVVALAPARGMRIVGVAAAVVLLALAALTRTSPVAFGHPLHLAFTADWAGLGESAFLLGSWNLLWFGAIGAALVAGRALIAPALAPL